MTEITTAEVKKEPELILGLDVSTSCIGICLYLNEPGGDGKIVTLTQISPKISNKIKGFEKLLLKKRKFANFLKENFGKYDINRIVIEEPLPSSNNQNTVITLLRFNGMIADSCYDIFEIAPEFISSHDARLYSFPDLLAVRKLNKAGLVYPKNKIRTDLKKSQAVLFGEYCFDIDKKQVMMDRVNEKFHDINWKIDENGEFVKENYDACDALVAVLGYINKLRYDGTKPEIIGFKDNGDSFDYEMKFADLLYHKHISLA